MQLVAGVRTLMLRLVGIRCGYRAIFSKFLACILLPSPTILACTKYDNMIQCLIVNTERFGCALKLAVVIEISKLRSHQLVL